MDLNFHSLICCWGEYSSHEHFKNVLIIVSSPSMYRHFSKLFPFVNTPFQVGDVENTVHNHRRKDFPDVVILKAVVQLPQSMMKPDSIDFILKENKADLRQLTVL